MTLTRLSFIALGAISAAFILTSCDRGPALIKGDKLNDYFPQSIGSHEVIVTTEKKGFAQASLKAGDEEVATLAITDLVKDPEATQKFDAAEQKISGYPAIARGNAGTAVLVGHFQVQARSKIEAFTEADRKKWLGKVDLAGLAKLRK